MPLSLPARTAVSLVTFASFAAAVSASAVLTTAGSQYYQQGVVANGTIGGNYESGDSFGRALATGDFNCDGYEDLAIGAPYEDVTFDCNGDGSAATNECTNSGAINVIYGSAVGLHPSLEQADQLFHQGTSGVPGNPEAGDHFGWALVALPTAEDCHDLAVGAPDEDVKVGLVTHDNAGAVFYFRATASGLVPDGLFVQGQNGVPESPEEGDQFGSSLAVVTDPNCPPDQFVDVHLAIGAPGEGTGILDNDDGVVVTVVAPCEGGSGAASFPSKFDCDFLSPGPGCHVIVPESISDPQGRAGEALAGSPNGTSLAIGAPEEDRGASNTGLLWIYDYPGNWDKRIGLEQGTNGFPGSREAGDRHGRSVTWGRFDGVIHDDLVVGAPYEDVTSNTDVAAGAIQIAYADGSTKVPDIPGPFLDQDSTSFSSPEDDDHFGWALAAGNFDGGGEDGFDDLVIGVPDEDVGTIVDAGYVHILYGSATGLLLTGDQGVGMEDAGLPGALAGDRFGFALAAGDFDGNGQDDLAIGAPASSIGTSGGFVQVLYAGVSPTALCALEFDRSPFQFLESAGTISIDVTRTGTVILPATVNVLRVTGGTASAGVDYVDFSGFDLVWAAGEAGIKTFQITINQDTLDEPFETIVIRLDGPSSCQEPVDFTIQIVDDDGAGEISFLNLSTTRPESIGSASVSVRRINGNSPGATAQYTTSNLSAIAGVDYTTTSGTVTFGSNDTLEPISVPVVNDGVAEGCEYVKLTLSSPGGGAVLGTPTVAQLVIYDSGLNLVYCDGFELGSTSVWSATSP